MGGLGSERSSPEGVEASVYPGEEHRAALALCGLASMGPATLESIAEGIGFAEFWAGLRSCTSAHRDRLRHGVGPRQAQHLDEWSRAAWEIDPDELVTSLHSVNGWIALADDVHYPARLRHDPHRPAVLLGRGDPRVLDRPSVGIIGTRRASRYGRNVAADVARRLAEAGVIVVSGLARGIDGQAHRGALASEQPAATAAVLGSGLLKPYPAEHSGLLDEVAANGVVVTEAGLDGAPNAWRFPARNRILAGLSDVIVVVESGDRGGSMHTVNEAIGRDRPVMAVPGPVTSAVSAGTNRLIADGALVCLDVDDVLASIGDRSGGDAVSTGAVPTITARSTRGAPLRAAHAERPSATEPAALGAAVAAAPTRRGTVESLLDSHPQGLDEIVAAAGGDVLSTLAELHRLSAQGSAVEVDGWWYGVASPMSSLGR